MQTATISCDHCGRAFKNTDPQHEHFAIYRVRIDVAGVYGDAARELPNAEWCERCCNSFGIFFKNERFSREQAPPEMEKMATAIKKDGGKP